MISKSSDEFIIGALIGSAIGVAAALMLAPSSGESLRDKIVNGFKSSSAATKRATRATGRTGIKSKLKTAAAPIVKAAKTAARPSKARPRTRNAH
ncbi:MAG: YtxH domain-containing protein [Parachlamydiaceae bacterium]|nr:YtxH domain-containing protein [Parachlamydiaceae bacterium]